MARTFVAARTPVEEELAKLWAEVLGLERVGVEDNLFDLGGHSLLATQILSRVRDAFQIEVPLQKLFERPTVAALAESLESIRRSGHGPQAPPARPGTLKETLQRSVLSNLDRLTDTEVEALLDELLSR
jgi:acyl carrier protein